MGPDEPAPDPESDANIERNAALAASALAFRNLTSSTLDDLLVYMIRGNVDLGWMEFTKPGQRFSRPCMIALAVGEDAVTALKAKMETLQNG